jgi:hypothetical protein
MVVSGPVGFISRVKSRAFSSNLCNGELERVVDDPPERNDASLPSYVPTDAVLVWQCSECGQHLWQGSHWDVVTRNRGGSPRVYSWVTDTDVVVGPWVTESVLRTSDTVFCAVTPT